MPSPQYRKKRLESDEWECHRQTIEHLYLDQNKALDEVIAYMKTNHKFCNTEQAYKKKLKRWRISKNIPAPVMEYMLAFADRRMEEEGKESQFYWHERPVDPERMDRGRQRAHRDKLSNPEKEPVVPPNSKSSRCYPRATANMALPAILRHIRCETPQPPSNPIGPLRIDIPLNGSLPLPSFTFTSFDPMMVDNTPTSLASPLSFYSDPSTPGTMENSPTVSVGYAESSMSPSMSPSDADYDTDFDELRSKLSMSTPSAEVRQSLHRANKLLQGGSALLPKTNIENMDVSRSQHQEALHLYRNVLDAYTNQANAVAIAESLRRISQIQANTVWSDLEPDTSLAERERLLSGYHFAFGQDSLIYARQVVDFCDKSRCCIASKLKGHVDMFRRAMSNLLNSNESIENVERILHTANWYHIQHLMEIDELEILFHRLVNHQTNQGWWEECENQRFISHVFQNLSCFDKAEPYLLRILNRACERLANGSPFLEHHQYVSSLFGTLSMHQWAGNPTYGPTLDQLKHQLQKYRQPSQFDCLEITCWTLLATAYANFGRSAEEVLMMIDELNLANKHSRPESIAWHSVDSIDSALKSLSSCLTRRGEHQAAAIVAAIGRDTASRWASPKLYPTG